LCKRPRRQGQGICTDPHTGQSKGWLEVKGKGGKVREIGVSPATYSRLEKAVAHGGGLFRTNEDNYRTKLKAAAVASGQSYEGSHGLRWSWAQDRHQELQREGFTYEQSLTIVSKEMRHERSDITCHYLH
jgi:integrase